MAKKKQKATVADEMARLDDLKRRVVVALFAEDLLLERLVLKGGNALDLIHGISTRASYDVDVSMDGDFSRDELDRVKSLILQSLQRIFHEIELEVFDFEMREVPEGMSPDLADFWGGYDVAFKLIDRARMTELAGDLSAMRRFAHRASPNHSTKFSIDISKHEFVAGKEAAEVFDHRVFVYSPAMMVCEKLRAICQQFTEYGPIVKRDGRPGSPRARDFVDIHTIVTAKGIEIATSENQKLLASMFGAKRVPLGFLAHLRDFREFHEGNFQAVRETVKPGVALQSFDFYFEFVVDLVEQLDLNNPPTTTG